MSDTTAIPASRRPSTWIALGLLALALGIAIAGFFAALLTLESTRQLDGFGLRGALLMTLVASSFASVGALIAVRMPATVIGWLLIAIGLGFGVALGGGVAGSSADWRSSPVTASITLIGLLAWYLIFTTLVPRLLLVFPDGKLPGRRWRVVDVVHIVLLVLAIGFIASPDLDLRLSETAGIEIIAEVAPLSLVLAMVLLGAGVLAMAVRFRRSDGVERQQVKWMMLTGVLLIVVVATLPVAKLVSDELVELVGSVLNAVPLLFPIAIGIAVLRYRLYEIDRIISRTIGWAVVTGLLVAVFVLLVLGLTTVLEPLTGGNTLAVAGSTLVVAALFMPVRGRVQRAVDRRFDRSRYDGERLISAFGERLRDEVDLSTIRADVLSTVDAAIRPSSVGLWLRGPEGEG